MLYKIEKTFNTALAVEKAKTVKFMFSNAANRPNIYRAVPHTHYNTNLCSTTFFLNILKSHFFLFSEL